MFTSRAEFRLLLRNDNVDERLLEYGYNFGLISDNVYSGYLQYRDRLNFIKKRLEKIKTGAISEAHKIRQDFEYFGWVDKIEPEVFNGIDELRYWSKDILVRNVNIEIKYAGYIARQIEDVRRMEKLEDKRIPEDFDYLGVAGLLTETKKKLTAIKPLTLGQASRVSGVNPSDITLLNICLEKQKNVSCET